VNEDAIFAAIIAQREVLLQGRARSKAARLAIARQDPADRSLPVVTPGGGGERADTRDDEARVPIPQAGETSGVGFW
jgi:hypothetical protein